MSSYQKAILKDAEQLGFTFDGFDGHGHIRLRHEQADVRYSMAATPGWGSGPQRSSRPWAASTAAKHVSRSE
jgi:hypothetical protein